MTHSASNTPTGSLDPRSLHSLLRRMDDDEPEIEIAATDEPVRDVEAELDGVPAQLPEEAWFVESGAVDAEVTDPSEPVVIHAPRLPRVYPTYPGKRIGWWLAFAVCTVAATGAALLVGG